MTPQEDARATWDLLSEQERQVLKAIDVEQGVAEPKSVAYRLRPMTWQRVVRLARQLKMLGLVQIRSLPKMTIYELTGQGKACLAEGQATGG